MRMYHPALIRVRPLYGVFDIRLTTIWFRMFFKLPEATAAAMLCCRSGGGSAFSLAP